MSARESNISITMIISVLTPILQDDNTLHHEINVTQSVPVHKSDHDLQDDINSARKLRLQYIALGLLAVKRVEALDRQGVLGHTVALLRPRSWAELYGSEEWMKYDAACEEVEAIGREEEKQWHGLLAAHGVGKGELLLEAKRNCVQDPTEHTPGATSTSISPDPTVQTVPNDAKTPATLHTATATISSSMHPTSAPLSSAPSVTTTSSTSPQLQTKHAKECSICVVCRMAAARLPQHSTTTPPALTIDENNTIFHKSTRYSMLALKALVSPIYVVLLAYMAHLAWCLGTHVFEHIMCTEWFSSGSIPMQMEDFAIVALGVGWTVAYLRF